MWKDRFICYWFYTPRTGQGYIHGYPIDWEEAHLLVRIDPNWDYDRQQLIPPELEDHVAANLDRLQGVPGHERWAIHISVRANPFRSIPSQWLGLRS